MGFSIYDVLNSSSDDSVEEFTESKSLLLNEAEDDEFDIDASLDDDENQDDQSGADNAPEGDQDDTGDSPQADQGDDGSDDLGGDDSTGGTEEPSPDENGEEVNPVNTDIFDSLTSEEQSIKIKELQKMFGDMYNGLRELNDRVDKLDTDEDNIAVMNKISEAISNISTYLADYIFNTFPNKSFIENDIMYNRFLSIIHTLNEILNKYKKNVIDKDEK